jgi:ABC-type multidrug transport system fused ATPase/permease subunit
MASRRGKHRNWLQEDQRLFYQRYEWAYLELRQIIGVISEDNFFRNGTLKENVSWSVPNFDEFQADLFAKELQIEEDL